MGEIGTIVQAAEDLTVPVRVPAEAYVSPEYAKAERDRLWRKVWLQAGRLEDIPEVGDFITFDILDDSVIVVRASETEIRAFHNVCPHRGRKLVDTPPGMRNARGTRRNFICGYHGWTFGLDGANTYLEHQEDWQGRLCGGQADLGVVQVGLWGGWVWINLDPDCMPLAEYLHPAAGMLDPYGLENMRPRWRKWVVFECNWKVAMEAFCETYHVSTTHPEFMEFGQFRGWARNQGLHSNIGYEAPKGQEEDSGKLRLGAGEDPRLTTAEMQNFTWANANTNTTMTLVGVANRLKDELPEGTPAAEVSAYWIGTARKEDAERGVVWAQVDPQHTAQAGTAWQIFPNFQIGHAVNNMLCYQARPYGADPDKCIFEAAVYELWPEGEAPETEWEYTAPNDWPPVLQQDFANMAAVQQGMKNVGFRGAQPNPYMERSVASLHMNLARFMGSGSPETY
ncbi:aromatic ring-hydroxylating oxygenase subunit alpha [Novosphingobium aerophilum]|uniref:aromatic ring-hydroxylating oxygenase subunit alpha n=1 Tax=Novosphingobium TaxID=165696 RepID=UPI0006C8C0C2|nr:MULTISPECIES: aromatic ring-hydroxylating dioxygenase subunit alpha [unclassified Novosphingobium]KPH64418.1 (2Fe-2S)-binding protein [Novosphingobium sp. ST904]MPS70393.1 aromatic ring-hydroxylating dioxygenase subunit alpha [Novosphingobium sp.]TCM37426.1 Rieske-like 2Fe-2S protein [Novosphingobium sp. ST904]WRT93617.1 aromatic ring-hydroxylating dioxygenase subunit alpha [Novosphingobium sp. RL4]